MDFNQNRFIKKLFFRFLRFMSVRHNLRDHAVHVDRFPGIKKPICIPHHVLIYNVVMSHLSNSNDGFHTAGPQGAAR